jgi:hypothetical protein
VAIGLLGLLMAPAQAAAIPVVPSLVNIGGQLGRFAEHHDAVVHADGFFQLMGDQDGGRAAFARQRQERLAQFRRCHLVKVAERFVG